MENTVNKKNVQLWERLDINAKSGITTPRCAKERKVHSHETEEKRDKSSDSENSNSSFIGSIDAQDENKEWTTSPKIDKNKNIKFKINTEAECNVISRKKTHKELSSKKPQYVASVGGGYQHQKGARVLLATWARIEVCHWPRIEVCYHRKIQFLVKPFWGNHE